MCPLCHACGLNSLAILGATAAAFILGGIWYAPPVFGAAWMMALGKTKEDCEGKGMGKPMVLCFIMTLLTAFALAVILSSLGIHGARDGALTSLFICAGFVLTSNFNDFLFTGWNTRVFWIGTGYKVIDFLVMGAILGAWQP
jgi:hypothetical protein